MWKAPARPKKEISQTYNDGLVYIYSATDSAAAGHKPTETLTAKITLPYETRRMGLQRFYSGLQNQIKAERVLRCPKAGGVTSQDVAITEDGKQYSITLVQEVPDIYPPSVDLTLAAIGRTATP